MSHSFTALLGRVVGGESLTFEAMSAAIDEIMSGRCDEGQIGNFLTALAEKGETAEEVAGAAAALRARMTPIRHNYVRLLDTCGTGGGGSTLFNVSTAAALVIAAAGVPVAKHGNRSITSRSGSADVLSMLGVRIDMSPDRVERSLDELGICFCFAPALHPAMRHVAAVRKQLGIKTIFNVLGPLANPAGATNQLLGAGRPELRPLLASALRRLGTKRAIVVSGEDGLGEVTLAGVTHATEVNHIDERTREFRPEHFGLESSRLDSLRVSGPEESATIVRRVLAGERGPARDIVVLNAAVGLMAFDDTLSAEAGAARAQAAIDGGAAADVLERLAHLSQES